MDIEGRTVIVTGAGSGIGRALAIEFAAGGARVVAGDLDEDGVQETARRVRATGAAAVALRADAAEVAGIESLITLRAVNSGPSTSTSPTPASWERSVWATRTPGTASSTSTCVPTYGPRLLVPHWKSTGAGYFVAVASAAGLLTQIGGAGYSVTKHAAVGFAEWLAVTYGDDGIGVSCVCPMAVDTPLMSAIRDAADPGARLAANAVLRAGVTVTPEDVAALTVSSVRAGNFLVLPHPEVLDMYRGKGADYDRWISGMRRYRRALESET